MTADILISPAIRFGDRPVDRVLAAIPHDPAQAITFRELKELLPDLTEKRLDVELRRLWHHGLIHRTTREGVNRVGKRYVVYAYWRDQA